jgi:hypothetical protein
MGDYTFYLNKAMTLINSGYSQEDPDTLAKRIQLAEKKLEQQRKTQDAK